MNLDWLLISDTVTWLEVAWTGATAVGAAYSSLLLREVIRDLQAVRTIRPRNGRHRMAKGAVRGEAMRLALHVTFVGIGFASMTLPNTPMEPARVVVSLALIGVAAMQTLGSYLDKHLRDDLRRMAMDPAHLPEGDTLRP